MLPAPDLSGCEKWLPELLDEARCWFDVTDTMTDAVKLLPRLRRDQALRRLFSMRDALAESLLLFHNGPKLKNARHGFKIKDYR